jgi:hypothetical protein
VHCTHAVRVKLRGVGRRRHDVSFAATLAARLGELESTVSGSARPRNDGQLSIDAPQNTTSSIGESGVRDVQFTPIAAAGEYAILRAVSR